MTSFDGSSIDEINVTSEHYFEFVLHSNQVEEAYMRIRSEGNQEVDIALRTEILPKDRAEEFKLLNAPSATERIDLFLRDIYRQRLHEIVNASRNTTVLV